MAKGKWLASGVLAGTLVCVTLLLFWIAGNRGEPTPLPRSEDDPRLSFATPYKNIRPEVQYVNDDLCAGCHVTQAESYRKHPMGRSLAPVATVAAVQRYDKASRNPFTFLGAEFLIDRQGERIFHKETRRNAQGEPFAATAEEVHYVIGSGVHNFSYLIDHDGCLTESPITWFTQKQRWDLSPGFSDRRDFFERPIPPECLFCHGNRVEPAPDTVNLYRRPIFHGYAIGCQRCHGPGELHVQLREQGEDVHGLDDTIVNPARLQPELREAVCQQCHLEGVARILAHDRQYLDYRPGLPWQLFWSVFVRSQSAPEHRIVSAVEQMMASRCFRQSQGKMGCISCHDPHRMPEPAEKVAYYRARCLKCHAQIPCSLSVTERHAKSKADDCVLCHMPAFNTSDIMHTAASDHQIPRAARNSQQRQEEYRPPSGVNPILHFLRPGEKAQNAEAVRSHGIALVELPRLGEPTETDLERVRIALPMIEHGIETWPDDIAALEAKSNGLSLLGRKEEALAVCEKVLSLAPRREQALTGAAVLARALGRPEAALSYWQRVLAVNPWPIQYHVQLAGLHLERKQWPQGRQECDLVLRRYPANVGARLLLVSYFLGQGDRQAAKVEFDKVLALQPPHEESLRRWFEAMTR